MTLQNLPLCSIWAASNQRSGMCIRSVWSESSLCTQWVAKDPSFLHANSEDSDQTGRMPRLIWVFAEHTCQGGCPGWSESSLSIHAILLVLSRGGLFQIPVLEPAFVIDRCGRRRSSWYSYYFCDSAVRYGVRPETRHFWVKPLSTSLSIIYEWLQDIKL